MDKRSLIFVFALVAALFGVNLWFSSNEQPTAPKQVIEKSAGAPSKQLVKTELPPTANDAGEEFYVLENAYQQLVFSNIGGSLSAINLPLKSESHPDSVIREIEFDRVLKEKYPQTVWFPNSNYYQANPQGGAPLLVQKRTLGGYYPLLRRSILGAGGKVSARTPPGYYGCNVVSSDPSREEVKFKLKRLEKDLIEFEGSLGQGRITKRFSFPSDPKAAPYCFDLTIKVDGDVRDLHLTSGVPEVELISGSSTPVLKYRAQSSRKASVEQIDLPKNSETVTSFQPDWVCNSNGFLGIIMDPLTQIDSGFTVFRVPGESDPTRLTVIDAQYKLYPADKYPGYEISLPLRNTSNEQSFRIFAGPFASKVLKTVDATYSDPEKGYNPNYISSQSFHGWFSFISEPFAKFLFFLMNIFHMITRSWGVSIILLTIALRVMLYPLNSWSIKSTSKMQQIAPEVAAIQAKHKKDPKRAQLEIVALYKQKGVNPFSGCLPILIQLPFLIGMFDLLKSTFELRGASFIPYWIDNLTAPDVVFTWSYPIIFFGTQLHLLPILIGGVMYWQQKISSPIPKDKSQLTDQQKQQKMMGNIMVIVFTVMFYHFPSGLNLYWLFSILLGILQQWLITRKNKPINPHIQRVK
ncbi:MAG: membrane protein insertase YidC [Chlamydiales bacterium]|nr:membrane protein insertase YidC [Chlamydiales bacterium]